MNTDVRVVAATEADKPVIANFWQLYMHDLARFTPLVFDETGRFDYDEYDGIDDFWQEGAHIFLIRFGNQLAGFAHVYECRSETACSFRWCLDSLFIASLYRRKGIGLAAARTLIDRFKGQWFICQNPDDLVAVSFWRGVVKDVTAGEFREVTTTADDLPCSRFYFTNT